MVTRVTEISTLEVVWKPHNEQPPVTLIVTNLAKFGIFITEQAEYLEDTLSEELGDGRIVAIKESHNGFVIREVQE